MKSRRVTVTFITKPGCHLCDDGRPVILRVIEKQRSLGLQIDLEELNMLEDKKLTRKYSEDIPVVLINKRRHSFWHVDEQRLTEAIQKRAGK